MANEIDLTSIDPNTPEGRDILVHICVYCHQVKDSVEEANACERTHEADPHMSSQDRHSRFTQFEKKFLRPNYQGSGKTKKRKS